MKEAYLHQPVPLFATFPRFLEAFPSSSGAFPHLFADLRFVYHRHFSSFSAQLFQQCPLGTYALFGIQRRPLGA